tara:strand:- start:6024 stop:7322 length:1299 start_codon:yes stop_codon:yes gene_type:complete
MLWLLVLSFICSLFAYAEAATITRGPKDNNDEKILGVLIEGEIAKGDYDKLYNLLKEEGPSWSKIYIASPGGDVAEAIKIGILVRKLLLPVEVPKWMGSGPKIDDSNRQCSSACFFIFVAGTYRTGHKIGIHRPSLTVDHLKDISLSEASNKNLKMRSVVSAYMDRMGVPQKYTDRMFKIDHDNVEFLKYEDRDDFFDYYDASVNEWLEARCKKLTPLEEDLKMTLLEKGKKKSASEDAYLAQLSKKEFDHIVCKVVNATLASQDAWVDEFVGDNKEDYEKAAKLFHLGDGTIIDGPKALIFYEKAARKGSGHAMFWMGNAHKENKESHILEFGAKRDNAVAIKWYKKGIKADNSNSIVALAKMYAEGAGVRKDVEKAIDLYEEAIEVEDERATKRCSEDGTAKNTSSLRLHCISHSIFYEDDLNALKAKAQ